MVIRKDVVNGNYYKNQQCMGTSYCGVYKLEMRISSTYLLVLVEQCFYSSCNDGAEFPLLAILCVADR